MIILNMLKELLKYYTNKIELNYQADMLNWIWHFPVQATDSF